MAQVKSGSSADRLAKIHPNGGVVSVLEAHDFTSAIKIASTAPGTFIDAVTPDLGGNRKLAETIYDRSTQIRSGVMHAWANIQTTARSRHFGALRVANVAPELSEAFEQFPSYDELFGSLNYCSCEECRSIFGAAAYLVDLLRVIDTYVTVPNSTGTTTPPVPLPRPFLFATRRSDIGDIPLTCAMTNDTFPLLRIVNERLGALARTYLHLQPTDDLFEPLSLVTYPFNLPFNLPAERIPLALSQIGVALSDVYRIFAAAPVDIARASFGMSPQQVGFLTTSLAGNPAKLAASYGVVASALPGLGDAATFESTAGLDVEGLLTLLNQGLSAAEIGARVGAGFFINAGLGGNALGYLPGNATTDPSITGWGSNPKDSLDRMSRFLRLASQLGWDYGALDWALRVAGAGLVQATSGSLPPADLSAASLAALAEAVDLAALGGFDLPTFLTLAGPVKPYGAGDGSVSTAPFDIMFNDPSMLNGAPPYHPTTPLNPLYTTTPLIWSVAGAAASEQTLATYLAARIGISIATLTSLATALWGSGAPVHLTLENLSALNRHARLMGTSGMTADGYLRFMTRGGYTAANLLSPTFSLADLRRIFLYASWLPGAGLTIDEIDYCLGGSASPAVDPLFQVAALLDWLAAVRQATASLAAALKNAGCADARDAALDQALFGQLATLFGASIDLIAAVHPLALAAASDPPPEPLVWEDAFTAPPAATGGSAPYLAYVTSYVTAMSRWLVLAHQLAMPAALVESIAGKPVAYGLPTTLLPTLDAIYWLSTFQKLVASFGDTAGRLMAFVNPPAPSPEPTQLLAAATGWDPAQTATLLAPLAAEPNRVSVAATVTTRTAMLGRLGSDPSFPANLISVLSDPTSTWPELTALADLTLSTARGRIAATQWPAIAAQLDGAVAERLRSVLAPYVLVNLRAQSPEIVSLRKLSEYLLLDVEVSGVLQISYIREALNAAQLYLQRCRLRLEPIQLLDIPEMWWEWLMNYRVWEANRKVFLYPENYIDPTLRKSATPLFEDLENKLLQGEVTATSIDSIYRTYVDGLVQLAKLEYVDAYHCTVDDLQRGPIDTTFYFARTSTDPYTYSIISFDTGVWSAWQPIQITIPAALVTPVYAFKRLFLFWVELKCMKESKAGGTASDPQGIAYKATIKYSFTDFNSNWIQPQALIADEVVYYMPSAADQQGALGPWSTRPDLFQMNDLFWNKVSATVVNPIGDSADQKLVVVYGPLLENISGATAMAVPTLPPVQTNANASDLTFAQQIFDLTNSYNELLISGALAYFPVIRAIVLDRELNLSFLRRPNELVLFERDFRENAPALFKPELETVTGTLVLATSDCAYAADYLADFTPHVATVRPPQQVTAASLQTATIDATTATTIFNDLVANGVVDGSGGVTPGFGADPDLSFLFGGTSSAQTDPYVTQVRTMLLAAAGDPTILANVSVKASRVVAVKNQPGTFLFSTGDETFLIAPRDLSYAQLTAATSVMIPPPSPAVFQEFFIPVSATGFGAIFADLLGNNVVLGPVGATVGQLEPVFDARTDLSFLFAGAPPAQKAAMINQVRRILLDLPTLTMLSYEGNAIPRFVQASSFITHDINAFVATGIFNDLIGHSVIDSNGNLLGEFSEATDLSFLFGGSAQPALTAEVRAVLLSLPKFVQATSFISTAVAAPIDAVASQAAFAALVQQNIIDAQGLVSLTFRPSTDLSFLFPSVSKPHRDIMIADVRSVVQRFYDSTYRTDVNELAFAVQRVSARASAHELGYILLAGGVDALLSRNTQNTPVAPRQPFSRLQPDPTLNVSKIVPPPLPDAAQIDFDGPYGPYYWELFFHAPMLVAASLASNQQFSDAKHWLEYILNPTVSEAFLQPDSFVTADIAFADSQATYQVLLTAGILVVEADAPGARVTATYTGPSSLPATLFPHVDAPVQYALMVGEVAAVLQNFQLATPASHYWQFRPFRNHTLEQLKDILVDPAQIATYNDDPFDPHAIARLRIGAYEKTILMKYVDTLIAWGDMLFTQFTWESITNATLLYMYAQDLLGPRPEDLGPCPVAGAMSFNQIKARNPGGIPQFLIDLEDMLGAPSGSPFRMDNLPFNALDAYFCVPENAQLESYWDRVADRLGKIRNGMNIAGVPTPLALWEPPIDPMALVRLAASGAGILGIESAGGAQISSNYRFAALHEQATELAAIVTELGATFLAALEKNDAAALDVLRATQETAILNLTTGIKQKQIDELNTALAGLALSRARAQFQADYYSGLAAAGLTSEEKTTADLQFSAMFFSAFSGPIHGIAIAGYVSPSIFGLADGGMKWGDAISAGAQIADAAANTLNLAAAMTATKGEQGRRDDDWVFQAALATRDAAILDNQIAATQSQLAAAQLDYAMNQRSIDQSNAVAGFLTSRFSGTDLYQWMIDRIAALYFQSYSMAVDAARKAELAYQYELNATDTFIGLSYWDNLHKGLLAGETLSFSLLQMKKSYFDKNSRLLEIEKTVSLMQLDPMTILSLRSGRPSSFSLTETMFDLDFPGHYQRQIASVSITIPALVGPYQNINAVLTQNSSAVVMRPDKTVVRNLIANDQAALPPLPHKPIPPMDGLRQNWMPSQEIAISRGVNDSGMFELNFGGERYMPFEGTGAVSSWTIAIPPENNRIDLSQLTDVIVELRYTAVDGGSTFDGTPSFRTEVIGALRDNQVRYDGALYFDAQTMLSSAWYAFLNTAAYPTTQTLTFTIDSSMFPYFKAIQLDLAAVRLIVADGVTIKTTDAFATLRIGSHANPLSFGLAGATVPDSPAAYVANAGSTGLAGSDFLAPWTLTITPAQAPPTLVKNKALDPAALLGVEFLLSYSADVLPSASGKRGAG